MNKEKAIDFPIGPKRNKAARLETTFRMGGSRKTIPRFRNRGVILRRSLTVWGNAVGSFIKRLPNSQLFFWGGGVETAMTGRNPLCTPDPMVVREQMIITWAIPCPTSHPILLTCVDAEFAAGEAMRWLFLFVCFARLCDPGGTVPREVELSRLFLDPVEETRGASRTTRTRSLNLADLEFEFEI